MLKKKIFFHLFACIGYNILQLEVVANKFKSKKSAFMTLIATEAERLISRFNGEVFSFGSRDRPIIGIPIIGIG